MMRATLLITLAAALGGCGNKLVDPCAKEAGACVAVQIDPSDSVKRLDSATIHVAGDGLDEDKSSNLAAGGQAELPVAIALVFDNITDATPVALTIDVTGTLSGNPVGGGSSQVSLAANQHATIHVQLTTGGIVAPSDMSMPADDQGGIGADMATCPHGTHDCSGQCVSDTSVQSCGTSCTSCPVGVNASAATCDGTSCGLQCDNGYHLCGGACVSSTSTDSCNMSCTPCTAPTGGTATCDGTQCGGACPANQKLCAGTCIPSAMACNGMCPANTHDCSGNCFADDSVNSCGTSCTPCAVPPNAMNAVCVNSATCDFVCNTNYKKCGSACIPATGCCVDADCAQPSNGTATCNTTTNMCVIACNSNYVDCSGLCKPIADVNSCGPSCMTCTAPANATPTCNGTSCDFACNSGYVRSGNSCVACGAEGQGCCASNACNAPFVCTTGTCQQKALKWTVVSSGTTSALNDVWVSSLARATAGGVAAAVPYCPDASGCGPGTLPTGSGDVGGVWGFGNTVYVAESHGNVYSSTSLGPWVYFSPMTAPDPDTLHKMTGDSVGNLYIIDGAAKVLTYKVSSSTWSVIPASSTQLLLTDGIWVGGPTRSDLYLAGETSGVIAHGAVSRSHDGGATWVRLVEPNNVTRLSGVWGAANGNVYIVGAGGAIRRLTLSSDTMATENGNDANGNALWAVWGSDVGKYYYAVGDGGTILRSTGDGVWHAETSPTTVHLDGVFGSPDGSVVWAVGDNGTVLRGQ